MDFGNLTPEQIEKAKACKTVEDLLALAKEEGVELPEDQLEAVAGGEGSWGNPDPCTENVDPVPVKPCIFV